MSADIKGHVLTADAKKAIYGATVEISGTANRRSSLERRIITNRAGEFHFNFKDSHFDAKDDSQVKVSVLVKDADGLLLVTHEELTITSGDVHLLDIKIDKDRLKNAKLPRQPGGGALISTEIFKTIDLAIETAAPPVSVQTYKTLAANFYCSLPPIYTYPDLLDIAEGVLRGHPGDFRNFQTQLDRLEAWNHRSYQYARRKLSLEEAEALLDADFLKDYARRRSAAGSLRDGQKVFAKRPVLLLLTATMRVAQENPIRINRNIGIFFEQLGGLAFLGRLYGDALNVFAGDAFRQREFLAALELFGGSCGVPDFGHFGRAPALPIPPGGFNPPGGAPNLPRPSSIPYPGGLPWPPDPRDVPPGPGDVPFNPVDDDFPFDCLALIREEGPFPSIQSYSIDSISPSHACPGETITIRGSNFVFEGHTGTVLFPGVAAQASIPAYPEPSSTDTEIRVVVPDGAGCGELELYMPFVGAINACGVEVFRASSRVVPFLGGDTFIRYFRFAGSEPTGCLIPGQEVVFVWDVCNATEIRLTIGGQETPPLIRTFDSDISQYTYTVPAFARNVALTVRLAISGPCGNDAREMVTTVRRGLPLVQPDPFEYAGGSFENFNGNHRRNDLLIAPIGRQPENGNRPLRSLLKAVEVTEAAGERLGVRGSGCSYTDIVVPAGTTRMIDPDGMWATSRDPTGAVPVLPPPEVVQVLARGLRDDLGDAQSVLSPAVLAAYRAVRPGLPVTPLRNRLIHVEAGIKLERLVCVLERLGLSMPTLGGGRPQSIAGAIGTGTHGSTLRLPPIADFIRAIHLVGPGGHQWWLEPASARITDPDRRITDPDRMRALKQLGFLDPCLRVRYDDDLFDAALVSFGTAGVIYSVIVETVDTQVYRAQTSQPSWDEAKRILRTTVLEPTVPEHWFFDITMDPTGRLRLSTLELASPDTPLSENPTSEAYEWAEAVFNLLVGLPLRIALELPSYIALESLRALNPFNTISVIRRMLRTIEMTVEIVRLIRDLIELFRTGFSRVATARLLPNALNLLWHLGEFMGIGRTVIDEIQNLRTEEERPTGTFVRLNHMALNWVGDPDDDPDEGCSPDTLPTNVAGTPNPFRRLMSRSSEYIVPAEDIIAFTEAIRNLANSVRSGSGALILVINLRFTQRTRALVGMQQFPLSGHVELFRMDGLNGNDDFEHRLEPIVEQFHAVPHWGQGHSARTDYDALYAALPPDRRDRLDRWRAALDELASVADTPNTFRHDFARSRGLLSDL